MRQRVGVFVGDMAVEVVVVAVAAAAHVFQVDQLGAAHLAQQLLVLGQAHAHLGGDLALGRRAAELLLELVHRGFDLALLLAVAAAHPVAAAQLVEHGAADALGGEGLELHALRGVEAASASFRPIMPTWIRSSSSTLAGSLAIIWCARRRTSGLYCLSIALLSRRPWRCTCQTAPDVLRFRVRGCSRPCTSRASAARRWRCRSDRRRPSRAARRRRSGRRSAPAARRCAARAVLGRGGQQQVERHQAVALRQQLQAGVGLGHAGRVVGREQQRAHRAAGEQAAEVGRLGVHDDHVGQRGGVGAAR